MKTRTGKWEPMTTHRRFWKDVIETENGCWERPGYISRGNTRFRVEHKERHKVVLAHRFAYEEIHGPIPEGLTLDHLCRNTLCVNPAHLEPVTLQVNQKRGYGNGRKAACPHGHDYDESNTYVDKTGCRHCIKCKTVSFHKWEEKQIARSKSFIPAFKNYFQLHRKASAAQAAKDFRISDLLSRKIISDLRAQGKLIDVGLREKNASGRMAVVWQWNER